MHPPITEPVPLVTCSRRKQLGQPQLVLSSVVLGVSLAPTETVLLLAALLAARGRHRVTLVLAGPRRRRRRCRRCRVAAWRALRQCGGRHAALAQVEAIVLLSSIRQQVAQVFARGRRRRAMTLQQAGGALTLALHRRRDAAPGALELALELASRVSITRTEMDPTFP